jgi:hypothetical protein
MLEGFLFQHLFEYRGGYKFAAIDLGSTLDFGGSSAQCLLQPGGVCLPNSSYLDATSGQYVTNDHITVSDGGAGFWTSGTYNRGVYSNYVISGNYWKWREASLSYRLPQRVLSRLKGVKLLRSASKDVIFAIYP